MKRYILLAIAGALVGCDEIPIETDIPDRVDVSADVEIVQPELKVIDGQVFVIFGEFCIAIDPSAPYPAEWAEIDEFDGYRGRYSSREIYYCNN